MFTASVQFSQSVVSDALRPHEPQHARPPSITNSWSPPKPMSIESMMPSNHITLLSPFPPALNLSQHQGLFKWVSSSHQVAKVLVFQPQHPMNMDVHPALPMNTQDWSLLGWTGWISLQSHRLSRVFSNTTVQKHQFFGTQLSLQSNSYIYTWPLEKP